MFLQLLLLLLIFVEPGLIHVNDELSGLGLVLSISLGWHSHPCVYPLEQGCQTHFHWGPHQCHVCLQRAECNFKSSPVKE